MLDDQPLQHVLPTKACALLYYLAVTGQVHHRGHLVGLLWAEMPEVRARNNLSIVRNRWKAAGLLPFLHITKREIGLAIAPDSDQAHFMRVAIRPTAHTLPELEAAAQAYTGVFLDQFSLDEDDNTRTFHTWMDNQRERWRSAAVNLFDQLIKLQLESGNRAAALQNARRQIEISPEHEKAHQVIMRVLAEQGEREQAIAQFQQCKQALVNELGLHPSQVTVALYDQIIAGEIVAQPKPVVAPFQAPAVPEHFVGRADLITHLANNITTGKQTVTAVVGMGGVGKSTMVAALAHQLRDQFPDGVLWAFAREMVNVLPGWAEPFGVDLTHLKTLENRAAVFRDLLTQRRVLLVLDDVLTAADIRPILPPNAHSHLLLTTRNHDVGHALDAQIVPLAVLDNGIPLVSHIIGTQRVEAEVDAAAELCDLLEQLPLALEIAAQRLQARPRHTLAMFVTQLRQVQSRLDPLKISDRAVRTSFALSWSELDEQLRETFSVLSVFEGRELGVEAVAAMLQQDEGSAALALDDLAALSMLTDMGNGRYRQHALLADFSWEQAVAADCWGTSRDQIVSHYIDFATEHQSDWERLALEWDNMQTAIRHAHERENWHELLGLTNTLTPSYFSRCRFYDARTAYEYAHKAATIIPDTHQQGIVNFNWGRACLEQNDYELAKQKLLFALPLLEEADDKKNLSDVMLMIGWIGIESSQHEEADQWLIDARELKLQADDLTGIHEIDYASANLYTRVNAFDKAEEIVKNTITNLPHYPSPIKIRLLCLQSTINLHLKNIAIASNYAQEAVRQANELGDDESIANALYLALSCAVRSNDMRGASLYAERCQSLYKKMGAKKFMGFVHHELSGIQSNLEQYTEAIQQTILAEGIFRKINATYDLVVVLIRRSRILIKTHRNSEAQAVLHEALQLAQPIHHPQTYDIIEMLNQVK